MILLYTINLEPLKKCGFNCWTFKATLAVKPFELKLRVCTLITYSYKITHGVAQKHNYYILMLYKYLSLAISLKPSCDHQKTNMHVTFLQDRASWIHPGQTINAEFYCNLWASEVKHIANLLKPCVVHLEFLRIQRTLLNNYIFGVVF